MISVRLPSSQRLSATELPLWATPQNYYVQCEAVQRYGSSIFCWFGIVLLVLLPCCLSCLDVCSQELTDVLLQIYFWRSIVVIEQQLLIIQWWYQHIQASLSSSSINSLIIPIAVVIRYKSPVMAVPADQGGQLLDSHVGTVLACHSQGGGWRIKFREQLRWMQNLGWMQILVS